MMRPFLPTLFLLAVACTDTGVIPDDFDGSGVDQPGLSLDDHLIDGVDYRTFAFLEVISTQMVDPSPFGNEVGTTVTTTIKRVDWEREGLDVVWAETLCHIEATEVFGTRTVFPDAFVDTFPVQVLSGRLSEAVTGATFTAGPHPTIMGALLDDPHDETLPTEADDPRVYDQDDDGMPGFTIGIDQDLFGEAEMYLVQRDTTAHDGVVVARDRIEGLTATDVEQVILDASAWWAETSTDSTADPEPAHSWFVLQQVEDTADCIDIVANHDLIF